MIAQLTEALTEADAISAAVLAADGLLRSAGIPAALFVGRGGDRVGAGAESAEGISRLSREDCLLYQFSTGSALNDWFAAAPCRRGLVYQNITPAEFFEPYDPVLADRLRWGREQLAEIAPRADFAIASSSYSARELRQLGCERVHVLSVPVRFERYGEAADPELKKRLSDGKKNILFVGRQAPNKCIEDVILFTDYYAAATGEPCRAVLPGERSLQGYVRALDALKTDIEVFAPGRISHAQLIAAYETADLFLCMSEHEGFCVPLTESMYFGVPVLAYAATAVGETLGEGAQLFDKKDFPAVAERMYSLLHDEALRERTAAAQKERLSAFAPERWAEQLLAILRSEGVL